MQVYFLVTHYFNIAYCFIWLLFIFPQSDFNVGEVLSKSPRPNSLCFAEKRDHLMTLISHAKDSFFVFPFCETLRFHFACDNTSYTF